MCFEQISTVIKLTVFSSRKCIRMNGTLGCTFSISANLHIGQARYVICAFAHSK